MSFQLSNEFNGVSVSHATLKPLHVLEALHEFLITHAPSEYPDQLQQDSTEFLVLLRNEDSNSITIKGDMLHSIYYHINESLWNIMNSISPDGHCFCSHPGNGSDFGFWADDDTWK